MFFCIILYAILLNIVRSKPSMCFNGLGCLPSGAPYEKTVARPFSVKPYSLPKLELRFHVSSNFPMVENRSFYWTETIPVLRERGYYDNYEKVNVEDAYRSRENLVEDKHPSSDNQQLYFIIHGFLQNSNSSWIKDIAKALLNQKEKHVIIVVDWTKGNKFPYHSAVANTRIVAGIVAKKLKYYPNMQSVHLIGHSLGAHICGYIGLDPAGPLFSKTSKEVHLDQLDGEFVQIVHSNGLKMGFGIYNAIGTEDIYLNGGLQQPGCGNKFKKLARRLSTGDFANIRKAINCDHQAANIFFISTIINKCQHLMYDCDSYSNMLNGYCQSTNKPIKYSFTNLQLVGGRTKYILTGSLIPNQTEYCKYFSYIGFRSHRRIKGKFNFKLLGNNRTVLHSINIGKNYKITENPESSTITLKRKQWFGLQLKERQYSDITKAKLIEINIRTSLPFFSKRQRKLILTEEIILTSEHLDEQLVCQSKKGKIRSKITAYFFACEAAENTGRRTYF
ncbi:hypothetical protein SNEBB_000358 [Seison nebaliae]|nr:hypothetical protein SNEBB_000358 [Seison nebaliae]